MNNAGAVEEVQAIASEIRRLAKKATIAKDLEQERALKALAGRLDRVWQSLGRGGE